MSIMTTTAVAITIMAEDLYENKGLQNNKLPIHDHPGKRSAPGLIMHSIRRTSLVFRQMPDRSITIESTAGGR